MAATDITHTVKASVSNGRRLMRSEDGSTYWEGEEPTLDYVPAKDMTVVPKRKRRKSEEGDK